MDYDEFYDDEPTSSRKQRRYSDEDNAYSDLQEDSLDLDNLFDFLIRALTEAKPVPLTGRRAVNVDMCLDVISNIRENLPETVQQCQDILERRDEIMSGADRDAQNILASAQARADSAIAEANRQAREREEQAARRSEDMIDKAEMAARAKIEDSEIMRRAREEALQMHNGALADANEQRLQASRYAESVLLDLERNIGGTLEAVRRSRQNVGK